MSLLKSLPPLYKNLIIALETMRMKELLTNYVTASLIHEMLKRKKKEPQSDNVAMVLHQD